MPKKQICAKCHRQITNNPRRLNGKSYHYECREEVLEKKYGK